MVQHLFFATVESIWSTCQLAIIALYRQEWASHDFRHMEGDCWDEFQSELQNWAKNSQ